MEKQKKMLWAGRFSQGPTNKLISYNSSENICLDSRLIPYDIQGSIAHVKMLAKQKILDAKESEAILSALQSLMKKCHSNSFVLDPSLEDVHMNVEVEVSKLTAHGKKMHTARSRNDQVILDTRLYMREELLSTASLLLDLCASLEHLKRSSSPYVSYTHTRVAQPITLAFWADSFEQSFMRDLDRLFSLYSRVNKNPLGACAVAGTGWSIDRSYTAKLLGFDSVQENAHDVSTSRGELESESLFILSSIMVKLSRICEELIILSEKKLLEIPDAYCTGSSIMPQKKNADFLEIMRGRANRAIGGLSATLSLMKGLISGYNSDTQETKPMLFAGIDITKESLSLMAEVIPQLKVDRKRVLHELEEGYACATELADLLAQKGVPFRDAHEISGKVVKECIQKGIYLSQLTAKEMEKKSGKKITDSELKKALSPDKISEARFKVNTAELSIYKKKITELREKGKLLL